MATVVDICRACQKLKEENPGVSVNGITPLNCKSLGDNTGLNPNLTIPNNSCEDIKTMNECFLGSAMDKLNAGDECDLKEVVEQLISDQYKINLAVACSVCGIFDKLEGIESAICKILGQLETIGVWQTTGQNCWEGNFVAGRGIAGGNINLFGGTPDGNTFIRTNNGRTENDLTGGI